MKINWIALGNSWMERELHYKLEIFGALTFQELLNYITTRSEKGHIYYDNKPIIMYDKDILYFVRDVEYLPNYYGKVSNVKAVRDGKYVDYYVGEVTNE